MDKTVTIGLVQKYCGEQIAANIEAAVIGIREAAEKGAQIICLQELFSSLYFCTVEDTERFSYAEPVSGATVSAMQSLAKELAVVIIVPFFEKRASGVYHNSAAVIDADGSLLGVYRKMHIPHDPLYYEKFYFTPGDADSENGGYQVFQTRYARVGVLICWDQWYPEAARITTMLGADILFYPTAIGWHPAEKDISGESELEAWQTMQRSHAIANGVYVAAVNRVGHEATPGTDGLLFWGRSFISDPQGKLLAEASDKGEAVLVSECCLGQIEQVRRLWPFFRDRRIDSYLPITARFLDKK